MKVGVYVIDVCGALGYFSSIFCLRDILPLLLLVAQKGLWAVMEFLVDSL